MKSGNFGESNLDIENVAFVDMAPVDARRPFSIKEISARIGDEHFDYLIEGTISESPLGIYESKSLDEALVAICMAFAERGVKRVVAHHAQFEMGHLRPYLVDLGDVEVFCTCKEAKKGIEGLKSYSMDNLSVVLDLPHPRPRKAREVVLNTLELYRRIIGGIVKPSVAIDKSKIDLARIPALPGCYLFFSSNGDLLYVGKATNLRSRVRSYFRQSSESRTRKFTDQIARVEYRVTDCEKSARVLEARLIESMSPRYNISMKELSSPLYYFDSSLRAVNELDQACYALNSTWLGELFVPGHDFVDIEAFVKQIGFSDEKERSIARVLIGCSLAGCDSYIYTDSFFLKILLYLRKNRMLVRTNLRVSAIRLNKLSKTDFTSKIDFLKYNLARRLARFASELIISRRFLKSMEGRTEIEIPKLKRLDLAIFKIENSPLAVTSINSEKAN